MTWRPLLLPALRRAAVQSSRAQQQQQQQQIHQQQCFEGSAVLRLQCERSFGRSSSFSTVAADSDDSDHDDYYEDYDESDSMRVMSMPDLVHEARYAVRLRKSRNIEPGSQNDPVMQLFRTVSLPHREWAPYAHYASTPTYTRNLIATDHATYSLLLLCWSPGAASPVHDHPCDGCWMKILDGTVREERFRASDLLRTSDDFYDPGVAAHITDNLGLHRVSNPSQDVPAASLHLYAPPIAECRTWKEEAQAEEPTICVARNYSEYGRVLR